MAAFISRAKFLLAINIFFGSAIFLFFDSSHIFDVNVFLASGLKGRVRKPYICSKRGPYWSVITSINYPTDSIRNLSLLPGWIVLIVADAKTPKDWLKNDSSVNVILLSIEEQLQLDFDLVDIIPLGNYARKNIGYLCAIKCGATVIYETDDDNSLIPGSDLHTYFFTQRSLRTHPIAAPSHYSAPRSPSMNKYEQVISNQEGFSILEAVPSFVATKPLVNPYALYGHPDIWPRGFPLRAINESNTYEFFNVRKSLTPVRPWIQQGLADLDPDVDAIYRLTRPKSIGNVKFRPYPEAIALGSGVYSPFNTQNTLYFNEAFWGLLIPFSTSIRVCDIWRGYWVQRLLWDVGGSLIFLPPTVQQIRNAHDYMKDFESEQDLYFKSGKLVDFLTSWNSSKADLFERMQDLCLQMAKQGFWEESEAWAMNAWIRDLKRIGYKPPPIKSSDKPGARKSVGRTAICLTGQLDRISKAWPATQNSLDFLFENGTREYDIFYYVSTYNSKDEADEKFLKTQILPTSGIIYDDPPLSPVTSVNNYGLRPGYTPKNLFNQLFAQKRCFEMVQKYSNENGVIYDFMMRLRTDHILNISNEELVKNAWNLIEHGKKIVIPSGLDCCYWEAGIGINDRIALGPISHMKHYMMRYDDMNMKGLQTLLAESFLLFILNYYNVPINRIDFSYYEV